VGEIIAINSITFMADIAECANILGWYVSISNRNTSVYSRNILKLSIYSPRAYWISKFL
jgi:ubiquitin-protein ligase